ncbi:hypothetical protein GCM10010166_24140 [Couchioplanes caeruleus subsp. azureus]|nr:hypothetical protein GCM10010166_24140 [Couchioplanes caeruleus subsp. azureus]
MSGSGGTSSGGTSPAGTSPAGTSPAGTSPGATSSGDTSSGDTDSDGSEFDEVFYCADEDGEVVDEDNCDDPGGSSAFFLWHSPGYVRGLPTGTLLDGGDYFPAGDRTARRSFKLPPTGKIANGTVKTNVVGRGSGGSGTSSGTSGG